MWFSSTGDPRGSAYQILKNFKTIYPILLLIFALNHKMIYLKIPINSGHLKLYKYIKFCDETPKSVKSQLPKWEHYHMPTSEEYCIILASNEVFTIDFFLSLKIG